MKNRGFSESLRAAGRGVLDAWIGGGNIRFLFLAGYAALILAAWLDLSAAEAALIVATVALVLVAEMLNTAIETAMDAVAQGFHPLAKRVKDVAAAAVLLAALASVCVAAFLFLPRLHLLPAVLERRLAHPLATTLQLAPLLFFLLGWITAVRAGSTIGAPEDGGERGVGE